MSVLLLCEGLSTAAIFILRHDTASCKLQMNSLGITHLSGCQERAGMPSWDCSCSCRWMTNPLRCGCPPCKQWKSPAEILVRSTRHSFVLYFHGMQAALHKQKIHKYVSTITLCQTSFEHIACDTNQYTVSLTAWTILVAKCYRSHVLIMWNLGYGPSMFKLHQINGCCRPITIAYAVTLTSAWSILMTQLWASLLIEEWRK